MKKTTAVIIASAILTATCSKVVFLKGKQKLEEDSDNIYLNKGKRYETDAEVQQSLSRMDKTKSAQVIKNINTSKNIVSLSFEGIEDPSTLQKILDMLNEYSVKATFIISAKEAAENTQMVQNIKEAGHELGTTPINNSNVKEMTKEEIISDLCKAKKVVDNIAGSNINLIKSTSQNYTKDFLINAYACGFQYAVEGANYISYQSFKNYEEAYNYINKIDNGSIICVKVNGVLDETEYKLPKRKETTVDIHKQQELNTVLKKKDTVTILDTIEWLLQAISLNNKRNVIVSQLPGYEEFYVYNNYDKKPFNVLEIKDNINEIPNVKVPLNKNENKIEELYEYDFTYFIDRNNGAKQNEIKQFYTTQESVSYTFRGIGNQESLDNVLKTLKNKNIKATFFVTKDDIEKYGDRIDEIVSQGHEIGNGGITNNSKILEKSVSEICNEIYTVDEMLKEKNIKCQSYMAAYGYVNDHIKEAVSVIRNMKGNNDYNLFTYTKAPVISRYKENSAENIIKDYFNTNTYLSLQKGEIVYFRLDSGLFSNEKTVADMVDILTENYVNNGYIYKYNGETNSYDLVQRKLGYEVVPLNKLRNTYSISYNNTKTAVANDASEVMTTASAVQIETNSISAHSQITINERVEQSQFENSSLINSKAKILTERSTEAAENMYGSCYIGNKDVELEGFTDEMKANMNKSGLIDTKGENVVFLTFDDWGSDVIINDILAVLKKHNVYGSFFTIGKFVDTNSGISNANPNLLRTIALEGHDVTSHTYNHETSDINKQEFKKSVKKSYEALYSVVGDTNALKPMLRFPTLKTTKDGLDAVFESGFDYCVSGNISTHDYKAQSAQEIADNIAENLVANNGNVVIMHMNNKAYYTPEALDIFLTNNENGVYGNKYKIVKLGDYLH